MKETIASIATALSSSGIGIIRISGNEAVEIADRIFVKPDGKKLSEVPSHTVHYGHIVDGEELKALTTAELAEIVKSTRLPLITKGVLSLYDADISLQAGVKGMVLSHHNNRIEYAIPPVYLLPEVCKLAGEDVPVFVDGMIQTGMDAFKAIALGAKGVCIGRPLMAAYTKAKAQGVSEYLKNARDELAKAMAYTGCTDLGKMDPSVIHVVK